MKKKRQAGSKQVTRKTASSSSSIPTKSSRKLGKDQAVKQGKTTTSKVKAEAAKQSNRNKESSKEKGKYVRSNEQPPSLSEVPAPEKQDQHTRSEQMPSQASLDKRLAFEGFCEGSTYLKRNQRAVGSESVISIVLPNGLPNKLLLRALQQQAEPYEVLDPNYIQRNDEQSQSIELSLDAVPYDKLATLVQELDTLISQFTARS